MGDLCLKCEVKIKANVDCVGCDMCKKWIHAKCMGVKNKGGMKIMELKGVRWFCEKCEIEIERICEKGMLKVNEVQNKTRQVVGLSVTRDVERDEPVKENKGKSPGKNQEKSGVKEHEGISITDGERVNKGNISYIDTDAILNGPECFGRDGVHLNHEGNKRLGKRLREWVNVRSFQARN